MDPRDGYDTGAGELPAVALVDILLNLSKATDLIDTSEPSMLAQFDEIAQSAKATGQPWTLAAGDHNVTPSTPMLALLLQLAIVKWFDGGANHTYLIDLELRSQGAPRDPDGALLRHISAAADSTAAAADEFTEESAAEASGAIRTLAETLRARNELQLAYQLAVSASNLVHRSTEAFARAADLILATFDSSDSDARAIALARHAEAEVSRVQAHPEQRLRQFEAIEFAAAAAISADRVRAACRSSLASLIDESAGYANVLRVLLEDASGTDGNGAAIRSALTPQDDERDKDLEAWRTQLFNTIGPAAMALEDYKLTLDDVVQSSLAETSWNTFSFTHPAFLRSVPDSSSLRREADADELLLVLAHETAHVLCLNGSLALLLVALRVAQLGVEFRLWTFSTAGGPVDPAVVKVPAPLVSGDLVALGQAEQALELTLKRHAIQARLTPWFEGVAVFVEVGADPRQDDRAGSLVTEVLLHLEDRALRSEAEDAGVTAEEMWRQVLDDIEARYGEAIAALGRHRLRLLFDQDPDRYLPGYLLVRAVVAAWRRTLQRELTGAEAARCLLWLTSNATVEAIPDLSLPFDRFASELDEGLQKWFADLSMLSTSSLETLLSNYEGGPTSRLQWDDGEVVRDDDDDLSEVYRSQLADYQRFVAQATAGLAGDRADLERAGMVDEDCHLVMQAVAEALRMASPSDELVSSDLHDLLIGRLAFMPIGSVSMPFWFNREHRQLAYLVRTRERDAKTGEPSYNMWTRPLDEEDAQQIQDAISAGARRIVVTRVAMLRPLESLAVTGANLVMLRIGDWDRVEPRGLLLTAASSIGDDVVPYLRARLNPMDLLEYEETIVAPGRACAQRTLQWLDLVDHWHDPDGNQFAVQQWVDHVRKLASTVLADEDARIGWTQLEELWGTEAPARLANEGFAPIENVIPGGHSETLRALVETGLAQCSSSWLDGHAVTLDEVLGPVFEISGDRWDVRRPSLTTGGA